MWAVERFGYQLWQALWYPLKVTTDEHGKAWYDVDLVHKKVVDSVRTMFNGRLLNVSAQRTLATPLRPHTRRDSWPIRLPTPAL